MKEKINLSKFSKDDGLHLIISGLRSPAMINDKFIEEINKGEMSVASIVSTRFQTTDEEFVDIVNRKQNITENLLFEKYGYEKVERLLALGYSKEQIMTIADFNVDEEMLSKFGPQIPDSLFNYVITTYLEGVDLTEYVAVEEINLLNVRSIAILPTLKSMIYHITKSEEEVRKAISLTLELPEESINLSKIIKIYDHPRAYDIFESNLLFSEILVIAANKDNEEFNRKLNYLLDEDKIGLMWLRLLNYIDFDDIPYYIDLSEMLSDMTISYSIIANKHLLNLDELRKINPSLRGLFASLKLSGLIEGNTNSDKIKEIFDVDIDLSKDFVYDGEDFSMDDMDNNEDKFMYYIMESLMGLDTSYLYGENSYIKEILKLYKRIFSLTFEGVPKKDRDVLGEMLGMFSESFNRAISPSILSNNLQ